MEMPIAAAEKKQKKKKDKVRSAWISFAGRIAAQLVGAAATVGLGVVMLNRYAVPPQAPLALEPRPPAITVIVVSPSETPQDGTTPAPVPDVTATQTEMARAIARAVTDLPHAPTRR